jgi:von Willebrand factor type A domain-containing protein
MSLRYAFLVALAALSVLSTARHVVADDGASVRAAQTTIQAGAKLRVEWTRRNVGEHPELDQIEIATAGAPDGSYAKGGLQQVSSQSDSPAELFVPDVAGEYEVRYLHQDGGRVLARAKFTATPITATLQAPASALGGTKISVGWTGPKNYGDTIIIAVAGTSDEENAPAGLQSVPAEQAPVELLTPEEAGAYEVRYISYLSHRVLARSPLGVGAGSATLEAAPSVVAGTEVSIAWTGPGFAGDYLCIVPKATPDGESGLGGGATYSFLGNDARSPQRMAAPLSVGEHEIRYKTMQSKTTLARRGLTVTPAPRQPGLLRVALSGNSAALASGAVEIILDASGSMLQKLGGKRRIDIAKATLTGLTSDTIPAGTPFALRIFGRGLNSCQTDLDIPLAPLDGKAVGTRLAALNAKSGAKTPIAASLEKVAADLQGAGGDRMVILITDGEETCGGDPAAAILGLQQKGVGVRVNIVGFAIDDAKLAASFKVWASAGEGRYFDAKDARGLSKAVSQALAPAFEVLAADGRRVTQGFVAAEPVKLPPGTYTVRIGGSNGPTRSATVQPRLTETVTF